MPAKRLLLASASLVACICAPNAASAADLLEGYDWSGSYLGGSLGHADHRARYEDRDYDWYGATHDYNTTGFAFGMQAGHNWQDGPLVYGIEADFTGFTNDRDQIFASDDAVNNQLNWMGSLRGRAGFGLDTTFLYLTAGLAVADFDRSWKEANDPDDSWPDLGETKVGVIGGIGVERAFMGNWTIRSESLIAKFGDNKTVNDDDYPLIIDETVFLTRVGVNYRFGDIQSSGGVTEGTPNDFSGFYAGLNAGGHMATISASDIDYDWFGSTYDHVSEGFIGGAQAGFNHQSGAALYGIEADFAWATGQRSFTDGGDDSRWDTGLNWIGSLKLKSGVAAGNTLMYVVGGLAVANYDDTFTVLNRTPDDTFDMDGTYLGFVVGTGIEQAFTPNLTARIEATYSAFDGDSVRSEDDDGPYRGHAQVAAVRAGLNYYFGDRGPLGDGALEPTANWSGFYAGADIGFAHHMGQRFDRVYFEDGGNYDIPSFGGGAGAHAGLDWQNGHFVFGVLGDFAFYTNDEEDTLSGYREVHSALEWMATLRTRTGLATGNSLIYATGGLAIAEIELSHDDLSTPGDSFDLDGTRFGGVFGIGVEHMVNDRWSVKAEALYAKFLEKDDKNGDTCSSGLVTEPCEMHGYDENVTMKLGLSYRLSN